MNKKAWVAMLVVAVLAGVAWWQRDAMAAWYHVRQLQLAYQEDCEACAGRVVELDDAAVPYLLDGLRNADAPACANVQYALALLLKKWGVDDPRTEHLLVRLATQHDSYSPAGQEKAVHLVTGMLQADVALPLSPRLTKLVGDILVAAERRADSRAAALLLAAELVDCVQPGQWVEVCRDMAVRGLKDERAGTRVAALQLIRREPMRKDRASQEGAVPLLRDGDVAVRRAALLSLASASDVVAEEAFLPLLHDEDAQVQYLCEMALRKRGLGDDDIRLARMISDKDARVRMRVLMHFDRMPELNLAAWLRQLSNDPEPAVRAAAIRAAADYPHIDLAGRLQEMAQRDPSDTIRQNASFYLRQRAH